MAMKKRIARAVKRAATPKHSALGKRLIAAGKEILAHVRGEAELKGRTLEVPDPKQIRKGLGLSQRQFAERFHFDLRTLQEWEQGRALPNSAVRAYLRVIDRNSDAVTAALVPTQPTNTPKTVRSVLGQEAQRPPDAALTISGTPAAGPRLASPSCAISLKK